MVARRVVGVWWLRTVAPDEVTAHGFAGDAYADGTVVEVLPPGHGAAGERMARARMRPDTRQLTELVVFVQHLADVTPPLLLHEVVRRDLEPVEVHLVAFLHDDAAAAAGAGVPRTAVVPPGTVLTANDLRTLGLAARDQVAAVRWNPATGQVLELYVDPGYRRRGIATTLLLAAEAACAARGWPTLWADGVRTAMGEALRRTWRWGTGRAAALSHVAPPMTPPGEESGRLH